MNIKKLITNEQFESILTEIRNENWKVRMLMTSFGIKSVGDAYNDFPNHLKPLLDELIGRKIRSIIREEKFKIILRDNKINGILANG